MIRIGVDFGGTKIEAAALDGAGVETARVRTANPGNYDDAIKTVAGLVSQVEQASNAPGASVGVGMPGSVSPTTGLIRNANSTWMNGRDFAADLARALARPVRLANDANCMILSETTDGAAEGVRGAVFGAILGTGCGGGIVVDGKLLVGANGIAGEWGHTPLPWPTEQDKAPPCWCGRKGCLETYISGTGLAADYARATGVKQSAEVVVKAARAGDRWAVAALDRYIDRLGRALAVIVDVIDPAVIVLAGGMSNVTELYDRAPDSARPHVFTDTWSARIAPAVHGDSSGVRGAARLWPLEAEPAAKARERV